MNSKVSLYLDILRVLASFLVLFSHLGNQKFSGNLISLSYGHEAVMIFFVMSGYVIAYVVNNKEKTFDIFMINRFARLYSVVVVALLLTPILDYFGTSINEEIYQNNVAWDYIPIRLFTNTFYIQELWFLNIRYFGNGPLWSLGFEFWYYVLFGLVMLCKYKYKYIFILVVSILVGPKILLYGVIWYFGVVVFNIHNKYQNIYFSRWGGI